MKTGDFNSIGPFNYPVTNRLLTLAINHGVGPYTLDYNYMILPNVSVESIPQLIKQYEEERIFTCISTNDLFHGTMWPTLKRASFVLWENLTTIFSCKSLTFEVNIQVNDSGAYIFSETDTDFTLTASHPIRWNTTMSIVIDRIGYGRGCQTSPYMNTIGTNMTIILPSSSQLLGASMNITCKKQSDTR